LFPDWNVCFGKVLTHSLPTSTQSGGAGGRGGEPRYRSYGTTNQYVEFDSYCDDNAQNDGQYCEGSSAGYSGCCHAGGSPGDAYDNDDDVSLLMYLPGSGGGAGAGAGTPGCAGGNGGASIVLYSTEMTLNGAIKANGGDGGGTLSDYRKAGGGGGSGGTVRIAACAVTTGSNGLSAIIQAKGGNGGTSFGGCKMIFPIHLFTFSSSFSLSLSLFR
jgi:hypothetical protein